MHEKSRKARQDLIAMRQKLALGQTQADIANELHRVDSYLQTQTRVVRHDLLMESPSALRKELARLGVEKLD